MRRINRMPLFMLLAAVVVVGCRESVTEPAEPLNQEEAEALFLGMLEVLNDPTPEFVSMTEDSGVIACPSGGQVTVAFDVREEMAGDTTRALTNLTLDPDGCVLSSEGYEFTLDGNPNVMLALAFTGVASTLEFFVEVSVTGGVDWMLDDRSGTCIIDLTGSVNPADPTTATNTGTLCGLEVELDAVINPPTGGG